MLLFGHPFIESQEFFHIFDIESIQKTPSNSLIYLEFSKENLDIIKHLEQNSIIFALKVSNITQSIYAQALGASYIVSEYKLAKKLQKIAENYLFDAKILAHISKEEEIETLALEGIDGAIFPEAIIKINS